MPKSLIVSASRFEIQPLLGHFNIQACEEEGFFLADQGPDISVLITGVGMVNTAYYLGRYSHNLFDHVINLGVCGAINKDIQLGEIVNVVSDIISEMGAEDDTEFIPYEGLNLGGTNVFKNHVRFDHALLDGLRKVKGITVNTVHGNEASIEKLKERFGADVESMEGAAFFRGCSRLSESYIQVRAVSNYVEKRDKSKWQMPLAIKNLNDFAIKLINDLNS